MKKFFYFSDPVDKKQPVNKCVNDVCLSLVTLINNAESTIDMAIYGFMDKMRLSKRPDVLKLEGLKFVE